MKWVESLDHWLSYSIRRRYLDAELRKNHNRMCGQVLEIGSGRGSRRGRFKPPIEKVEGWTFLDLQYNRRPHVAGNVEHLPFKEAAFDTVVCLEVLEYVADPHMALQEIHRVLKPQGTLILATPFLHRADTEYDYWRFTDHGMRYLLKESGFSDLRLSAQGHALGVCANILQYAIHSIPSIWQRRFLACLSWPFLMLLQRLDFPTARRLKVLKTFSTGYLVIANRLPSKRALMTAENAIVEAAS